MAKNKEFIKLHKKSLIVALFVGFLLLIPPVVIATVVMNYYLHIYPGVFIENTAVTGQTVEEATSALIEKYPVAPQIQITIQGSTGSKTVTLDTEDIAAQYEYVKSAQSAYEIGRSGNIVKDVSHVFVALQKPIQIPLSFSYNKEKFDSFVQSLTEDPGVLPVQPQYQLKNGSIVVENGQAGDELPQEYVSEQLLTALTTGKLQVTLNTKRVDTALTQQEMENALARAQGLETKQLVLLLNDKPLQILKIDKLLPFLSPRGGYNPKALESFINGIAQQYNQEVKEPVFNFDGKRVQEFSAGEAGVAVNKGAMHASLLQALATLETSDTKDTSLSLVYEETLPKTNIANVNNLGIKELIGTGTSRFSGSIPSRIHNVALASSRINGVLVAPNETFSFAQAIGDISKYTGYQEAYIIQNGKTILGDGGGVCQVSTTLFRAVMNAGLPIVERHAHAYRVGYYEQNSGPGIDATVFVPSVDFKFKNDTGNYILVQTAVDTKNLTAEFKIYGTSDGRRATVTKPVVTNQIEPEEDLYVDDPTLALGKVTQVEHKAWGARVSFDYRVEKDGQELFKKTFVSVYQPWRAVFMRGTKV